ALSEIGTVFFITIATIQISLALLAAPAATAGAVCLDRARGTLAHVLVTDLSDAEIVLGKLAARLAPVFALVLAGAPVMALAPLLGGIVPGSLVALLVISLALAVLGCALALAVSARVSRPHEALAAVYGLEAAWVLAPEVWEMLQADLGLPRVPD